MNETQTIAVLVVVIILIGLACFYFINKKSVKAGIEATREDERKIKTQRRFAVHIRVHDETLERMSDEERNKYLEELGRKQAEQKTDWRLAAMQEARSNPFPEWVMGFVRSAANKFSGDMQYDHENRSFVINFSGDKLKADKVCDYLDQEYIRLGMVPENQEYKLNHRLINQVFLADEQEAMDDLVEHLSPGGQRQS